ncbi:MAG: cation-translocating P-type ATPase [Clostridiales bacterium]|nr:cation-translocating P-type ATPase [Clostridiales bacterium]
MQHYFSEADTVISEFSSSHNGLTKSNAEKAFAEYGANVLEKAKKKSTVIKLLEQLKDPMIIILIIAGVVSGSLGEIPDMCIILFVVVVNAVLGVFQENKAEAAIEALSKMSAQKSKVRRDGVVMQIKAEDIVPGDIVILEAGDSVPADMRLISSASLKIEEAALTGESVPAEKHHAALSDGGKDIPLGDRINMAYMGTNAVYGRGEGVVTATGMKTEMGKIAAALNKTEDEKTPLQIKLASLSKVLSIAVIGICVFIFAFGIVRQGEFTFNAAMDMFMTAISLAVAAIPEGLVVVVTVLLSIGVTKMSKRGAIIRKLTAVETLGCAQTICSDKTGTLTQNKMTVTAFYGTQNLVAKAGALCGDVTRGVGDSLNGEPTELAITEYALKLGIDKWQEEKKTPRVGEAPFDSIRKMMTTVHKGSDGTFVQYTKGGLDEILSHCSHALVDGEIKPIDDKIKAAAAAENKKMAANALRVLGVALKNYSEEPEYTIENLENKMTFLGFLGMVDPARPEVKDAIARCKGAGIRPIMITGDHRDTAVAIAKELGILRSGDKAVTGAELAAMNDTEFEKQLEKISVYARVQPEHKARIVNAWKQRGKITAMTGDGVNDAPALKHADIGVGMGITGTDVTKNVADLVLADDNFATIVYAVEEGRRIYENIRKAIQFLLASNMSEVVAVFVATMIGIKHLLLPIHILWINLVTDMTPAMALGMEDAEPDCMQKPPREATEGIFSKGLGFGVIYQGLLIAALTLAAFFIGKRIDDATATTMAFFTLSTSEVFHSFNLRSRTASIFSSKKLNKYLIGAGLLGLLLNFAVVYTPVVHEIFKLVPLSPINMFYAFGLSISVIPIVEIVKAIMRITHKK